MGSGGTERQGVQAFLPVRCELRLPTVDLAGARALLGRHEEEIKLLADEGALLCWNIALPGARRMERRFLVRSLRDYACGRPVTSDPDMIELLICGTQRPWIAGRDFHRAWNCDSAHMISLVEAGVLAMIPGHTYGRGPGHTPRITWASAVKFLEDRRL